MRIALINEASQNQKNKLIYETLKKVSDKYNHTLYNFGMYEDENNNEINFSEVGILASLLIEADVVDFVVTGCGSGQGAAMSMNAFPNIVCGTIKNSVDAFLFKDVNQGNAVSLAFSQDYGWAADKNLEFIFEHLFNNKYNDEFFAKSKPMLDASATKLSEMKQNIAKEPLEIFKALGDDKLKAILDYPFFRETFEKEAAASELKDYILELI